MERKMPETSNDVHNRLARDFVMMAGQQTDGRDDLLVVIESTILASMQLMVKLYGTKPSHASILLEAALQNATERFERVNK